MKWHNEAAELVKIVNERMRQLTEPHLGCPFKDGQEGSTHYFIRGLLQAQGHLEGGDVNQWVFQPIIWLQLQKLEFWQEWVVEYPLCEQRVYPSHHPTQVLGHFPFHYIFELVHLFSHTPQKVIASLVKLLRAPWAISPLAPF